VGSLSASSLRLYELEGPWGLGLVHICRVGCRASSPMSAQLAGPGSLGSRPLPQLGVGLVTKVFPCYLCLGSPSVIGEGSGPQGGPHKPHQRLPVPIPQSGDHQESCFPFSPSSPTLPLPLPQPSLSSFPPPTSFPAITAGSTFVRLPEGAASPRSRSTKQKNNNWQAQKGKKTTKLRVAFVYK